MSNGLAIVQTRACLGLQAIPVTVEAHISNGLPSLSIVGLPETAVKESRDRVRSALINTHFEFPARRITINLAPADLPKEGGRFDLPIALSILAASGQLPKDSLHNYEFTGELALSGMLRPVPGILPVALATRAAKRKLIVPLGNGPEVSLISDAEILPANNILQVFSHLTGQQLLQWNPIPPTQSPMSSLDLADIQGQAYAKRALEIAAAGKHSLLFIGPPGTGKTMLANRLPGLLPSLTEVEALEVAAIASISGQSFQISTWRKRPFRSPHHTVSSVALVGGSNPPRPGEISLAHQGVLFLDELPEFKRSALEALRQPMESGKVTISRAAYQAEFPANFQFIAAMNPCPCGYWGDSISNKCQCSSAKIKAYLSKLSGPLLDRIDLHVEVPLLAKGLFYYSTDAIESTAQVLQRVQQAQNRQLSRNKTLNNLLPMKILIQMCKLNHQSRQLLDQATQQLGLSGRAHQHVLSVARTIADLANSPLVCEEHLMEALTYRRLERFAQLL